VINPKVSHWLPPRPGQSLAGADRPAGDHLCWPFLPGQQGQWLASLEQAGKLRRPVLPRECTHNAHMYYILLPNLQQRTHFIEGLKAKNILSVFHYIPLHSSPRGQQVGRTVGDMTHTNQTSDRLVRLPLSLGLEEHLTDGITQVMAAA